MLKKILVSIILLAFSQFSNAQLLTIEGIVVDAETLNPLPFAAVGVQGSYFGTTSNSEGRFMLSVPEELRDSILFCTYMGYREFETPVKQITGKLRIEMIEDIVTLDEVEVRPWEPWDYIWNAMQKIQDNYGQKAYMSKGYYSEYISENDVFLKFTEGVVETYNPGYGADQKSQSKVLQARKRNDLGTLQFMREKLDKKWEKEKRKAQKKGEAWEEGETIDEDIISASFGGPEEVLSSDPLRDTASFLDIDHRKKYRYSIAGYSRHFGEQVIIIGFSSKGKYEHQRQIGKVYISLESDAILSIEYDSEFVIPALAKPVLFLMGLSITNLEMHATIHYRPIHDSWYLNSFSVDGGAQLTKKKIFSKNERSRFDVEMALVVNEYDLEDVAEIPEEERIDNDKPLEEQVEADPEFWESYHVARPSRLTN